MEHELILNLQVPIFADEPSGSEWVWFWDTDPA
jgi:hypothetical protein